MTCRGYRCLCVLACAVLLGGSLCHAQQWKQLPKITSADLRDIWGSGASDVYIAGGYDTTLLHYDGVEWTDLEQHLPGFATADTHAIWGLHDAMILTAGGWSYYGMHKGNILYYNGTYWKSLTANPNSMLAWTNELHSIWGSGASDIFAVGERNYVLTQLDWVGPVLHYDGTTVVEMANPRQHTDEADLFDVWGAGPDAVFAVGRSLDRVCVRQRCLWDIFCYCSEYEDHAATSIMRYDGSDWELVDTGVAADLYGVWGAGPACVFAVGQAGTILHYDGTAWQAQETPTDATLRDVWGTSCENVYAIGDAGTILHYDGSQWQQRESPVTNTLHAVWGSSAETLFAAGDNGTVLLGGTPMDYGDAPAPFPTTQSQDGARHGTGAAVWLGETVTTELLPHGTNGDIGDDGVAFPGSSLVAGGPYEPPYSAGTFGAVRVTTGGTVSGTWYLHGWIDWNGDGDWDDSGETVVCGRACSVPGIETIEFTIPADVSPDCIWARFRLQDEASPCSPTGATAAGEVEDYEICPTLINLESFSAFPLDRQVQLTWTTASEVDCTGFYLLRAAAADDTPVRITDGLIAPTGAPDRGATYSWTDSDVSNGTQYSYTLADVDTSGAVTLHGPVRARPDTAAVTCSALDDIAVAPAHVTHDTTSAGIDTCFACLLITNTGSQTVQAFWYTEDSYFPEDTGWHSIRLEPGQELLSDEIAWGRVELMRGAQRTVQTPYLGACYTDGPYAKQCGDLAGAIMEQAPEASPVELQNLDALDPCN